MATQNPITPPTDLSRELRAFGEALRKARRQANVSKRQLAAAARLDRAAITRIEQGKRAPKFDKLLLLAHTVGSTPAALLAGVRPDGARPTARPPRGIDPEKRFAANLKWARQHIQPVLTQEELALEAEIDRSSPNGYETGRLAPPTLRTILKLAAALDVSPSLLLTGVRFRESQRARPAARTATAPFGR